MRGIRMGSSGSGQQLLGLILAACWRHYPDEARPLYHFGMFSLLRDSYMVHPLSLLHRSAVTGSTDGLV